MHHRLVGVGGLQQELFTTEVGGELKTDRHARLVGCAWQRSEPVHRPAAAAAFIMLCTQVVTGIMLFLPEAKHIASNSVFQAKLFVIALALSTVAVLEAALLVSFPPAAS